MALQQFYPYKTHGYLIDKFKSRLRVKRHITNSFCVTLTRLQMRGNKFARKEKIRACFFT